MWRIARMHYIGQLFEFNSQVQFQKKEEVKVAYVTWRRRGRKKYKQTRRCISQTKPTREFNRT